DRKVAIKLVHDRRRRKATDSAAAAHEDLRAEAQLLAQLSHPNVVAIHDVGRLAPEHGMGIYIVMEHLDG
ncbi:MAG: hypothetical protein KC431_12845, partial [Myxococcales bacterium]|nr:hypothetical protein [Myxococcales bacterium]